MKLSNHLAGILLLAICLALVHPIICLADPNTLDLSVGVRQEYNDNIFFHADDTVSDFITIGILGVDLGRETERLKLHTTGHWEAYGYHDHSELNEVNQNYGLSVDYRFTERLRGTLSGAYIRDYQRDREIETTGVVFDNKERKRHEMGSAWEYMLSDITTLTLSGTWWKDDYTRNSDFREDDSDLESWGGNMGLIRAMRIFDHPIDGRLNIGAYRYQYETSKTDNIYLNLGFNVALSETLSLLLDAGPRYTESDYPIRHLVPAPIPGFYRVTQEMENSGDWGGAGRLSLGYKGRKTFWDLALSHNIAASSGQNQSVKRTELRFDGLHRFTWEWQGFLYVGYFKNQSDRADSFLKDIDKDIFMIYPRMRYNIGQNWSILGSYRYTWEKDDEDDETTQRHQVMIEMVFNWPVWE